MRIKTLIQSALSHYHGELLKKLLLKKLFFFRKSDRNQD